MLAWPAKQALQIQSIDARLPRFHAAARVERFKHRLSNDLLDLELVFGVGPRRHKPPAVLPLLMMHDVVSRSFFGVAEHAVGVVDLAEAAVFACLAIVGMKSLRKKPIDSMDCLGLG